MRFGPYGSIGRFRADLLPWSRQRVFASDVLCWAQSLPSVRRATLPGIDPAPNPLLVGTRLFVATATPGALHCLDSQTGDIIWSTRLGTAAPTSLRFAQGAVYALTRVGIHALDANNGRPLWLRRHRQATPHPVPSEPSVANDLLYFVDLDGRVHALELDSGSVCWSSPTARVGARERGLLVPPVISDNCVFVPTLPNLVSCLNATNGSMRWQTRIRGAGRLIDAGSRLVAFSHRGIFFLRKYDGQILKQRLFSRPTGIVSCLRIGRHLLIASWTGGPLRYRFALLKESTLNAVTSYHRGYFAGLAPTPDGAILELTAQSIFVLDNRLTTRHYCIVVHPFGEYPATPFVSKSRMYILANPNAVICIRWPLPGA